MKMIESGRNALDVVKLVDFTTLQKTHFPIKSSFWNFIRINAK